MFKAKSFGAKTPAPPPPQQQQQQPAPAAPMVNPDADAAGGDDDYAKFGKDYMKAMCGWAGEGAPLKPGARVEQYKPSSLGGFVTGTKVTHDASALKPGDFVVHLGPTAAAALAAASKKTVKVVPLGQRTKPGEGASSGGDADTFKPLALVSDDDDDGDGSAAAGGSSKAAAKAAAEAARMHKLLEQLGRTAGVIRSGDANQLQVELAGSGTRLTAPRVEFREATATERQMLQTVAQERQRKAATGANAAAAAGARRERADGDDAIGGAGDAASACWLQPMIYVTKKSTANSGGDEDGDDDDGDSMLTVMRVTDRGARATLSSGETLSATELVPVAPSRGRNAILIRTSAASVAASIAVGSLVTVKSIDAGAKTAEVSFVGVDGAPAATAIVPLSSLCSTSRVR